MRKPKGKQFPISSDELLAFRNLFFESMDTESDRGCVLVGAAFLDEALEMLLRSKMLRDESTVKRSVDWLFLGLGPLKSFWSKIQLCRSLGMLEDWEYQDLDRIRQLRNLYAHIYDGADFEDPAVVALNQHLVAADKVVSAFRQHPLQTSSLAEKSPSQMPSGKKLKKERVRFVMSVSWLSATIHARAGTITPEGK